MSDDSLRRRPVLRAWRRWLERHQHPFNFWIHVAAIPLALIVAPILLFTLPWARWYCAVAVFVLGYVLQWLGHCIEGNDAGEWVAIKRLLGLPYVAISPRYRNSD